jgi:hypothetical protein
VKSQRGFGALFECGGSTRLQLDPPAPLRRGGPDRINQPLELMELV